MFLRPVPLGREGYIRAVAVIRNLLRASHEVPILLWQSQFQTEMRVPLRQSVDFKVVHQYEMFSSPTYHSLSDRRGHEDAERWSIRWFDVLRF
jgi:hypothetical protein